MRALRSALRSTAETLAATATPDDLAPLRRFWEARVDADLLPVVRRRWLGAAAEQRRRLERAAETALRAAAVDEPTPVAPVSEEVAAAYLATARNRLVGVSDFTWWLARDELLEGLQKGESVAELQARIVAVTALAAPRAEVIARTEVIGATNRGSLEQMYAADLGGTKEWIATGDHRTRETHRDVNRKKIAVKDRFTVGGYPMDGPHDPAGPAGETINCRCTLIFDVPEENLVTEVDELPPSLLPAIAAAATDDEPATGCVVVALPEAADGVHEHGDEEKHLTLLWLGDAAAVEDLDAVGAAVAQVARNHVPFGGAVNGWAVLGSDQARVLLVDSSPAVDVRDALLDRKPVAVAVMSVEQHPTWIPHVTVGYPDDVTTNDVAAAAAAVGEVFFDRLALWAGDDRREFPLRRIVP